MGSNGRTSLEVAMLAGLEDLVQVLSRGQVLKNVECEDWEDLGVDALMERYDC